MSSQGGHRQHLKRKKTDSVVENGTQFGTEVAVGDLITINGQATNKTEDDGVYTDDSRRQARPKQSQMLPVAVATTD